jgi:dihydrofolate reductase
MRKLVYGMLTSLDLYVEGPDGHFAWATPDAELHRHFNERAAFMTTHLYGRRMWETMSAYWPTAGNDPDPVAREFARLWNAGEHIVFSRTLESVAHGARLVTGDAVEEIRRLKVGEGSDLEVSGPGLASACLKAGLVDELHAYINPVAVGGGKRFFTDLAGQIELTLLGVQTFSGGVVQLRYQPKRPVM